MHRNQSRRRGFIKDKDETETPRRRVSRWWIRGTRFLYFDRITFSAICEKRKKREKIEGDLSWTFSFIAEQLASFRRFTTYVFTSDSRKLFLRTLYFAVILIQWHNVHNALSFPLG